MHALGEERDGLSTIQSEEEQQRPPEGAPARRTSWIFGGSGGRAATDPMAAEHRAKTFNERGGDVFAVRLIMPGSAEDEDAEDDDDDSLPVSLQVGSDGLALREPDDGALLKAVELENVVRWGKTSTGFTFSFTEDSGETIKKLKLRTLHGAALVDACNRLAQAEMSARRASDAGQEVEVLYSSV